ncbi:MAG: hypothetical protein M3Z19_13615, partial [Chloroflexota bacterium]|nr:hypothetical protein [Chloroflexota bacterium]
MIGTIARVQWRATVNSVRRTSTGRRRFLSGALFTIIFAGALGLPLFVGLVLFFRSEVRTSPDTVTRYLPIIFVVVTLFMLFGNFVATLSTLYFSPTLPLLLAAPVPTRTVFAVALANGSVGTPFALLATLLALVAYGIGVGVGVAFYPVAIIGMLAVSALVAAVTQILIVGLLRIVPARRVREALTLLGAVMSVLAYALWYGSSAGRGRAAGVAGRFQTVTDRTQPLARWTPPGWAGNAAAATQAGDAVAALGWSLLLFVATGALIGCAYALFRRAFLVGWSGTREVAPRRSATRHTASLLDRISTPWSPPVRAIAIKEIRTLVRDTKRLSIIVRSIGFVFVYLFLFIFRRTASGVGTSLPTEANSWLRLLILITFLLMGLSNGVSGYVFGTEGTAFGLYRLAPIAATTVLVAKWLAGVCLVAPFSMIVALGAAVWLRGGPGEIALAPVIALSYTLGLAAIRVAAAAISPRFDAPQPNR